MLLISVLFVTFVVVSIVLLSVDLVIDTGTVLGYILNAVDNVCRLN